MAIQLTISGDDALITDGLTTYAEAYGWTATVKDDEGNDIDNPTPAVQFAASKLREYITEVVKAEKSKQADAVRLQILAAAEAQFSQVQLEVSSV